MLLHAMQEFNDDFRARSDQHLPFPSLLCIVDGVQRIIENTRFDHVGRREILNSMGGGEVSIAEKGNPYQPMSAKSALGQRVL